MKRPLEALQDPTIRTLTIYKAVQTGGTLISEIWVAWLIDNDPGPTMWNFQTDEDAEEAAQSRIHPLFEHCPPVAQKLPRDRRKLKKTEIYFYNMWLLMQGPGMSNLQTKSVKNQVNDEVWIWPPGRHGQAIKRTSAFSRNCKILNISQGGMKDDEMDLAYQSGTMEEWGFRCPKCNHLQPYTWDQMKYDTNDITHPNTWNFEELKKTVRYECVKCAHAIRDTPRERRQMNDSGQYIVTNPNASKENVSCHWPAWACDSIKWDSLVEEWVRAQDLKKNGSIIQLKDFMQKRSAKPFEERYSEDKKAIINSDYSLGDVWPEEHERFIGIDKQKDHFWMVCRAFSKTGASRLIWKGRISVEEDLREKQIELGVTDRRVLKDSGYEASQVYKACARYGWTAMKGEYRESFPHPQEDGPPVYKPFSLPRKVYASIGTDQKTRRYCPLILWSNPTIMDILDNLMHGKGPSWGVPKDVSEEYLKHMDSHTKRRRHDKMTGREKWEWVKIGTRPDHMRDCELQIIVAAIIAGLLLKEKK